jgi:polyhydroxyalkanoate synthase subunit PhaC
MILEKTLNIRSRCIEKTSDMLNKMLKLNMFFLNPPEVKVGQTPHEIVYRKHKTKLLHYKPPGEKVHGTPLLIAYALINKPYVMDLLPGRSIIEVLVKNNFDVYLIDWGTPTSSDCNNDLNTYVNLYIDRMVDRTIALSGSDKVSLLGYCMGGTMALLYTALHQEKIRNLITMTTPFDCSSSEGLLYQWSKDFPADEIYRTYGNCPGWLLAHSFSMLKPMGPIDKVVDFYDGILNDKVTELFLAMEKWLSDTQDVPGRVYAEVLRYWFQQNLLAKNEMVVGDEKVDFRNITCPYLNLVAEQDTSIPPVSSMQIGDHTSSTDKELMSAPVGHIGLAVSGKALKQLWPRVVEWLQKRSDEPRSIDIGS